MKESFGAKRLWKSKYSTWNSWYSNTLTF